MPHDVSSSEDESQEQSEAFRFQCPDDFASFSYSPSFSGSLNSKNEELWLIKAPARFDPKCFANLKVSLSGLQMVQSCGSTPQIYSILSGEKAPTDISLLISKEKDKSPSLCSSGFAGILNISESYGNCGENQGLVPIPAAPAPSIPPGLRQRFQPFGSSVSAQMEERVTAVSPTASKRTRLDAHESEEPKKKKKKKKEKNGREEASQEFCIKQEPTQIQCGQTQLSESMEEDPTEARRKKKKVKKEKERECEDTVDTSLISKEEPLDPSYGDIDTTVKSKKKKKKTRNE